MHVNLPRKARPERREANEHHIDHGRDPRDELREHGILELTRPDCEILVHSMIERIAELEADIEQHQLEPYPSDRT